MELNKKAYDEYIRQITPVNELGSDMLHAFVTGGIICALGQASVMLMMNYLDAGGADPGQYFADRFWYLPEACEMGWSRGTGSYHRLCEFRGGACH